MPKGYCYFCFLQIYYLMQGERFHSSLFRPEMPMATVAKQGRGRNIDLVARRNEKIAYRYYYHAYLQKKHSWEVILRELHLEFDLSEATLARIITVCLADPIRLIFKDKPEAKQLKQQFPYFQWS